MSKLQPRRRPFVLVEVLIASSLFVMLLVAIFGIFWRTSKTNTALNKLRIANEHMLIAQARLQNAFSAITTRKVPKPYFYVEPDKSAIGPSLVFTIKQPTTHDPEFSGNVLLKLYVEDNQLTLATFPYFEEEKGIPTVMQKEALLTDITGFEAEFFLAPESQQDTPAEEAEGAKKPPTGKWTNMWLKEYERTPTLVKLHIERGKSPSCTLWMFIPVMVNTIVYDKG